MIWINSEGPNIPVPSKRIMAVLHEEWTSERRRTTAEEIAFLTGQEIDAWLMSHRPEAGKVPHSIRIPLPTWRQNLDDETKRLVAENYRADQGERRGWSQVEFEAEHIVLVK